MGVHALTPDSAVIWTIARPALTDAERDRSSGALIALLDRGWSADAVLAALAAHGLVPLAYRHFIASGDDQCLPPALHDALSSEFRRHACSRLRFARLLRSCLEALEAAGIQAIPFKGPALAVQLFGNFAMRQYGDLDILVPSAQLDDALATLARERLIADLPARDASWTHYLRRTRHAESVVAVDGTLVELHWAIADRFHGVDLPLSWLFESPATIDLLGRRTRVMNAERTLLALCLHGARHLWERAAWLSEIATLVHEASGMDWGLVFAVADRVDLGLSLRACLWLVAERFEQQLPAPWAATIGADRRVQRLAAALRRRLAAEGVSGSADQFRLGYLARGNLRRRATFCWRVATDLSERDVRPASPSRIPAIHGLRRTARLLRAAVAGNRTRPSTLVASPMRRDTR